MKSLLVALSFAMCFCFNSLTAEEIQGVEYSLGGDGMGVGEKQWKVANTTKNDTQEIRTYIISQEGDGNWSELFTVQAIQGLKMEPEKFFTLLLDKLKSLAPGSKLENKTLSKTDTDLLGEWWISEKGPQDQHEWVRLIQSPNGLVILRYTIKNEDDISKDGGEKKLETWKNALKSAKVKS